MRASAAPPAMDAVRELYLGLLLGRFECGAIQAYEYTERVRALGAADTVPEMAEIVDAPGSPEPHFDTLELALLARSASTIGVTRRRTVPYFWMALVVVFFLALLGIGLWVIGRAQPLRGNGGPFGAPAPAAAPAPVLLLS